MHVQTLSSVPSLSQIDTAPPELAVQICLPPPFHPPSLHPLGQAPPRWRRRSQRALSWRAAPSACSESWVKEPTVSRGENEVCGRWPKHGVWDLPPLAVEDDRAVHPCRAAHERAAVTRTIIRAAQLGEL